MKKILLITFVGILGLASFSSCSVFRNPTKIKNYVNIETSAGNFVIGLYEGTNLHKNNFLQNCENGLYDSTLLFKAVKKSDFSFGLKPGFTENAVLANNLKNNNVLSFEGHEKIYPKRGAIGMKRVETSENPEKKSDNTLFFIVEGTDSVSINQVKVSVALKNRDTYNKYIEAFLKNAENKGYSDTLNSLKKNRLSKEYNDYYYKLMQLVKPQIIKDGVDLFDVSKAKMQKYVENGGVPMFEGKYSFFGEIVFGIDILRNFSKMRINVQKEPYEDVFILSTKKMSRKEFVKKYKKSK